VNGLIQDVIHAPGQKWPDFIARRRERGLHIPFAKQRPYRVLVTSQDLHINIVMLSRLPAKEEINRPSSRNPPGCSEWSKEPGNLTWTPRLPNTQWVRILNHLQSPCISGAPVTTVAA
jgi:hypothetical protein